MPLRFALFLVASATFAGILGCGGAQDDEPVDGSATIVAPTTPTDAASEYRQIYQQLGKDFFDQFTGLDTIGAVDANVDATLRREQSTIQRLLAATRLTQCDFRIDLSEGALATLPHLAEVRALMKLLNADALRLAQAGDDRGAATRAAAIVRMSRQVGEADVIVAKLIAFSCLKPACTLSKQMADKTMLSQESRQEIMAELRMINAADPFNAKAALAGERRAQQAPNAASAALGDIYGEDWRIASQAARDAAIKEVDRYLSQVETMEPLGAVEEIKRLENAFTNPLTKRIGGVMSQYRKQTDTCRAELRTALAALQRG